MERSSFGTSVRSGMFSSLRHRNYWLLWTGSVVSQSGDWMDQMAFNWLILELTGSPLYLGLVNLCRGVPVLLFTLIAGVAADRFERRKIVMVTQIAALLLALTLAALVSTGLISLWHVFVIATLRGVVLSFNLPVRQTMISDLVPREDLPNAVALNSVTFNLTRIIGPAIGGVLIGLIGVAGCFYVNAASFVAVIWTLHLMKIPPAKRVAANTGLVRSLTEGFGYIRSQPTLLLLVTIAVVPMFFGQPYLTMLTVYARDVLAIGPTGLGVLTSATGLGAVIGGLVLAPLGSSAPRGKIMLIAMIFFGLLLMMFSFSTWPLISVLLLLGAGAMNAGYNATNNTLLQLAAPDEFRGRVLSTLFINRGLVPLGTALAGTLAVLVGISTAVASMAAVIVFLGIIVAITSPRLRALK